MRQTTTALTTLALAGALTAFGLAPAAMATPPAGEPAGAAESSAAHRAHHGHGPRDAVRASLDTISTVLNLTIAELREARQAGTPLAELAEQQGVEVDLLIDALVADAEEHLAERVASGDVTREQADERLDHIEQRITDRVNGVQPERGERGPGHDRRVGAPSETDGS